MEEIFDLVKQKLDCSGLPRPLSGGIVITGGGAALAGAVELAEEILKMSARLGTPIRSANLGGLIDRYTQSPVYATAIGLVLEGDKRESDDINEREPTLHPLSSNRKGSGLIGRIKNWFGNGLF
jgi:cell division protein FtsA